MEISSFQHGVDGDAWNLAKNVCRLDPYNVHIRSAACSGRIPAAPSGACKVARGGVLGQRWEGWKGRVQSRDLRKIFYSVVHVTSFPALYAVPTDLSYMFYHGMKVTKGTIFEFAAFEDVDVFSTAQYSRDEPIS